MNSVLWLLYIAILWSKILSFCNNNAVQQKDKGKLTDACISVCATDFRPMCIFEGNEVLEYSK